MRVYDTIHTDILDCIIPIIASLLNCTMPSIIINMVDVGKQRNGSDCGVLALAMAFDLCAGHDPSGVIFDHKKIRQHLKNSLESCSMSRFPITSTRRAVRRRTKMTTVPIHCTCRMPHDDDPDTPWAECTSCHSWYHKNCVDVPEIIFQNASINWMCPSCKASL